MILKENPVNFVVAICISLLIGLSFQMYGKRRYERAEFHLLTLGESLVLTVIVFSLICVIGAIPFLELSNLNPLDALFASVSGFTTTGMGILGSPFSLPKSVLLWYAETQWIGGFGIIVLFLYVVTHISRRKESVSEREDELESHYTLLEAQGYSNKFDVSIGSMTTKIFGIYAFFTIIGFMLLVVAGLNFFDALVLTFSTISTGGFSNLNVMSYFNPRVIFVLCLIMLTGAISFLIHLKLFRGKLKEFSKDVGFYISLMAFFITLAVSVSFKPEVVFYVVSALTTTGNSIPSLSSFHPIVFLVIFLGMLIGGFFGSTAGGIKANRVFVAIKSIGWYIKKLVAPKEAIIPLKVNEVTIEKDSLLALFIFMFTYLAIMVLAALFFIGRGTTISESFFNVASAMGNVGFTTIPLTSPLTKVLLMGLMVFGRLEIFPVLIVGYKLWARLKKRII